MGPSQSLLRMQVVHVVQEFVGDGILMCSRGGIELVVLFAA